MSAQSLASEIQRLEVLYASANGQFRQQRRGVLPASTVDDRLGTCPFPPAFNFTDWTGPDVKMPVPWCEPRTLPPQVRTLEELAASRARLSVGSDEVVPVRSKAKVTVIPSLIVPCCAHSGTTFLWRCMRYAFHPSMVCGRTNPASRTNPAYAEFSSQWNASECGGRKYLLPGLAGTAS